MGKSTRNAFYQWMKNKSFLMFFITSFFFFTSSCLIKPDDASKDVLGCESDAYKELKDYTYKAAQWGGIPPTKNLTSTFKNNSTNASINEASLQSLVDTDEYEVSFCGQNGEIRYTNGLMGCYTIPPCLKSDGQIKKAGTLCADAGTQPQEIYVRSIENYNCENMSVTQSISDWKNLNSPGCEDKPKYQSASGVFRFRIKSSVYQNYAGNPNFWFTDDHGAGYQTNVSLSK